MAKTVRINVRCPHCKTLSAIQIVEDNVGEKMFCVCSKCQKQYQVFIPSSFASKFVSDPTVGATKADVSLFLETIENELTPFQMFELTADLYTIGRKNDSGPQSRPDIEIATADKKMSRKHAVIKRRGNNGFTIKDIGSKNGIIVSGKRLEPDEELYLNDQDTFQLGATTFRVSFSDKSDDYEDLTQ